MDSGNKPLKDEVSKPKVIVENMERIVEEDERSCVPFLTDKEKLEFPGLEELAKNLRELVDLPEGETDLEKERNLRAFQESPFMYSTLHFSIERIVQDEIQRVKNRGYEVQRLPFAYIDQRLSILKRVPKIRAALSKVGMHTVMSNRPHITMPRENRGINTWPKLDDQDSSYANKSLDEQGVMPSKRDDIKTNHVKSQELKEIRHACKAARSIETLKIDQQRLQKLENSKNLGAIVDLMENRIDKANEIIIRYKNLREAPNNTLNLYAEICCTSNINKHVYAAIDLGEAAVFYAVRNGYWEEESAPKLPNHLTE